MEDSTQLSWLEQIKEMQNEARDNKDFLNSVKIDLFSDTVFVFSPKGEVYELPAGLCSDWYILGLGMAI